MAPKKQQSLENKVMPLSACSDKKECRNQPDVKSPRELKIIKLEAKNRTPFGGIDFSSILN
jgi:hypothetical protein